MSKDTNTKKSKRKKLYITIAVAYVICVYFVLHIASYWTALPNKKFDVILQKSLEGLIYPFYFPGSITTVLPVVGLLSFILLMIFVLEYTKMKINEGVAPSGTVGGTSKFQDDQEYFDNKYKDLTNKMNMRMSEHVYLSMNTRKTRRNNNIVVIGGAGSGKSRFLVKPNLCEMPLNTSFVITDPAGELLAETGTMLCNNGYKVKTFNLVDMEKSDTYNPLNYIHTETDVILLVDCILKNTTDPNKKGGEDFWEKAQALLFQACIFLLWMHGDELHLEKNMNSLLRLISGFQVKEDSDSDDMGTSGQFFEAIAHTGWYFDEDGTFHNAGGEKNVPAGCEYHEPIGDTDIGYRQYNDFKIGAGKTLKSILISANARLAVLKIDTITGLLADDNIGLEKIGDEKTALFIIIPAENDSFNFIAAMLYTQLFQALYFHAGNDCLGSYRVYDSEGEVVKTFFSHAKEEQEENVDTTEITIDFTKKKESASSGADTPKKKVKRKKEKGKNKEKTKPLTNEEIAYDMKTAPKYEDIDVKDKDIPTDNALKEQVKKYIENTKNVKLTKIGRQYLIKIPDLDNKEEIIGVYNSKALAIKRCQAIVKGCTFERSKAPALPYHVRFMLDEFANIGQIPEFTAKLATMRKHEISCTIILQNMAQIKKMYKDDWGSIMGNCDSLLFLGSPEYDTLEYISKILGKKTQKQRNMSISYGSKGNTSNSIQENGRNLMDPDELYRLDNNKCIYILRGEFPFLDNKCPFDERTKNYEYTADADENNTYVLKKKLHRYNPSSNAFKVAPKEKPMSLDESSSSHYYTPGEVNQMDSSQHTKNTTTNFSAEKDADAQKALEEYMKDTFSEEEYDIAVGQPMGSSESTPQNDEAESQDDETQDDSTIKDGFFND